MNRLFFESDEDVDSDSRPLQDLLPLLGRPCSDCGGECPSRDGLFSIALGFKNAPRCLKCLSSRLDRVEHELLAQLLDYVHRRECYRKAWVALQGRDPPKPADSADPELRPISEPTATEVTDCWDAGDMACGDLVLALRLRLHALPPGSLLTVRATDAAAPEDLPAWCRMTGHQLILADHPNYLIRRKGA